VRCKACDKIMTNYELTNEFVDLCNECSRFLVDDDLTAMGNVDYADLYDLEELRYVEDEQLDYATGTEHGDEGEWS